MYISKIRIKNYKSFLDSGDIYFEPGINIITGQNNSGKSTLLRALCNKVIINPHKSSKQYPVIPSDELYEFEGQLTVSGERILQFLKSNPNSTLCLRHGLSFESQEFLAINKRVFDQKFANEKIDVQFKVDKNGFIPTKVLGYEKLGRGQEYTLYGYTHRTNKLRSENAKGIGLNDTIKKFTLFNDSYSSIYYYSSEKNKVGQCGTGPNTVLDQEAMNLAEVVQNFMSHRKLFGKYHDAVCSVLPHIGGFSVKNSVNRSVEVIVWNDNAGYEDHDITFSLSECGTGVSQVLSILYVVLSAKEPQVIIIDEPSSFLHPGATRKLVEIFKENPQHQYIISTHSPELISAANPQTIHIVRMENAQSVIEKVDMSIVKNQQRVLLEVGSKLSDVFGADNILWVEGPTEEICFKNIIDQADNLSLHGTAIIGVKNTGDFESKKTAKTTFDVYRKLSSGVGLMPPAIGFIFDLEDRGDKEIAEMQKEASTLIPETEQGNHVGFLGRRMFENYLLNVEAIAYVLSNVGEKTITVKMIETWIDKHKLDSEFKANNAVGDDWIKKVDAAKLLNKMFSELTQTRVSYSKTKHSVALCDWLLENKPEALSEIVDILKGFLQPENAQKTAKVTGTKKA